MNDKDFDLRDLSVFTENNYLSALPAIMNGLCLAFKHCLHNNSAYQDLLEEEIDGNNSAKKYLQQCKQLTSLMQNLLQQTHQDLILKENEERLGLHGIISGVVSRYEKIMQKDQKIETDVDDNLFIQGNVYQIQEMLYRYLDNDIQENKSWYISGHYVNLTSVDLKQLHSNLPAGMYAMLAILRDKIITEIPSGFYDISEEWASRNIDTSELMQLLYWSGVADSYNGCVLEKKTKEHSEIIILLPMLEGWKAKTKDYSEHHFNDSPKTILLVDDEDMIWDVINDMLQDMGYQVILAGNGIEAVEIYENNPHMIDLVLLDMIMPKMGGQEAFMKLKKIDPNVNVLLSSGYVSGEEVADVLNAGAKGFLKKPYRMADLAKKIKEIIEDQ
ncbi:MAG: response regulator [Lentisphaeria bacterium]